MDAIFQTNLKAAIDNQERQKSSFHFNPVLSLEDIRLETGLTGRYSKSENDVWKWATFATPCYRWQFGFKNCGQIIVPGIMNYIELTSITAWRSVLQQV